MNLADFTYWTSLSESQKSYYVFEIPDRSLTELDDEYTQILTQILDENSNLFSYEISTTTGKPESSGAITISFKSEKDELLSAIYGETLDFVVNLVLPGISSQIKSKDLERDITRIIWQSTSKKVGTNLEVTAVIDSDELDTKLMSIARVVCGRYATPEKPIDSDFIEVQNYVINRELDDKSNNLIKGLTDKISEYTRYTATLRVLHNYITYTSTPDLEKVKSSFKNRLSTIKSLDPEKEEDFKEILSFQKDLLTKSNIKKIENPVTTNSLIEVFRIVLNKIGDVREIKKELDKITS
jgi:hypothetical protein